MITLTEKEILSNISKINSKVLADEKRIEKTQFVA